MAIDYRKEWEKFRTLYGKYKVSSDLKTNIRELMDFQVSQTINEREKLMEEYVREGVQTEIVGGEAKYYTVKIVVRGHMRGCISISKDAFQNWLKKRKEVK